MANTDKEKIKEINKKKKSIFKSEVKKTLNKVKKFFSSKCDAVKKMNKSTKAIILVWVLVVLVVGLMALLVGISTSNREMYHEMEDLLYEGTMSYVTESNVYPTVENKAYIPLESLILGNHVDESKFLDKVDKDKDGKKDLCKGYSIVYYNGEEEQYSVETFVSCNKYTSKYYNDYLDYLEK